MLPEWHYADPIVPPRPDKCPGPHSAAGALDGTLAFELRFRLSAVDVLFLVAASTILTRIKAGRMRDQIGSSSAPAA
jgi:hypothetical protein